VAAASAHSVELDVEAFTLRLVPFIA
jgi:hypothetical protein